MNETEARSRLAVHVGRYRAHSYEYLAAFARLEQTHTSEIETERGEKYQIKVQVRWEKTPSGSVRVIASISEGWDQKPITQSFIKMPDGDILGK